MRRLDVVDVDEVVLTASIEAEVSRPPGRRWVHARYLIIKVLRDSCGLILANDTSKAKLRELGYDESW